MPNKGTNEDARLTAFVGAKNAADAARIIEVPGKTFRDKLRRAGHYETKGTGWTTMGTDARSAFYPVAPTAE
jgi:short subunit dehydrogenase-like uncharacterized protein